MFCLDWEVQEPTGMWRAQVSNREIFLPVEAVFFFFKEWVIIVGQLNPFK